MGLLSRRAHHGFRRFLAKDRQVSGNGSLDDPTRKTGSDGRSEIVE
jgi:hypothetical protein